MEYLTPSGELAEEGPAGEEAETRHPLGTGTQRALDAIFGARQEEHRVAEQGETYAVGDAKDREKRRGRVIRTGARPSELEHAPDGEMDSHPTRKGRRLAASTTFPWSRRSGGCARAGRRCARCANSAPCRGCALSIRRHAGLSRCRRSSRGARERSSRLWNQSCGTIRGRTYRAPPCHRVGRLGSGRGPRLTASGRLRGSWLFIRRTKLFDGHDSVLSGQAPLAPTAPSERRWGASPANDALNGEPLRKGLAGCLLRS